MSGKKTFDRDKIIKLFEEGKSTEDIAQEIGCSKGLVWYVTKDKPKTENRRTTPKTISEAFNCQIDTRKIWALFKAGWTLEKISDEFLEPKKYIAFKMLESYEENQITFKDDGDHIIFLRPNKTAVRIKKVPKGWRERMLKQSIETMSNRYAFKDDFEKEMPEYFEAVEESINAMQLQLKLQETIKNFKLRHGREDMINAGEVADLLESLSMEPRTL